MVFISRNYSMRQQDREQFMTKHPAAPARLRGSLGPGFAWFAYPCAPKGRLREVLRHKLCDVCCFIRLGRDS